MTEPTDTPFIATDPDVAANVAALRQRLIQSELRAAARDAGMHDLDGLKLLDQSSLALDDRLELPEAGVLIGRLKRDKPYLFTRSSSTAAAPPSAAPAKGRNAMDMTLDEWRAARADLLRRR